MLDDLAGLTPDLSSLGWTTEHDQWVAEEFDAAEAEGAAAEETVVARGRIARVSRGFSVVFTGGDAIMAASASARSRIGLAPATGDFVVVTDDPEDGPTIAGVAPRSTELARRAAGRVPEAQVLAANIDHVFVMETLDRDVSVRRVERQLTIAWDSGATPVVILTKADAVDAEAAAEVVSDVQAVAPGAEVIPISSVDGSGLDKLRRYFGSGGTVALLGLSGIGKSTLVNALTGGAVQRTGEVRATDRRGRHTTVTRDLIPLPEVGGFVIDTPGIREVGLWQAYEGLALAFPEIAGEADACRFADCHHDAEPGCEVRRALNDGVIPERRLEHWRELGAELALQETQLEEFARRSESRDRADADRRANDERSNQKQRSRSGRKGGNKGGGKGSKRKRR